MAPATGRSMVVGIIGRYIMVMVVVGHVNLRFTMMSEELKASRSCRYCGKCSYCVLCYG